MALIAAGQMCSSSSLKENGAAAVRLIQKAVSLNCKALFLPEAADYIARDANHSISICKSVEESPFVLQLRKQLRLLHSQGVSIFVNAGVHEPAESGKRVKNTLLWFDSKGEIVQRYQKVHLFDVELENGPIMKESNCVEPGNTICKPFQTDFGKLGLGICYDMRFPEVALRLRSLGAEVICFPSAFTQRTGAAHWHLLGRARAIDSQCYVVMAAQCGAHDTSKTDDLETAPTEEQRLVKRVSYGHSIIVDPWGTVVGEVSDITPGKEGVCVAEIDLERLEDVRKNMPLWQQRRPDVFGYEV